MRLLVELLPVSGEAGLTAEMFSAVRTAGRMEPRQRRPMPLRWWANHGSVVITLAPRIRARLLNLIWSLKIGYSAGTAHADFVTDTHGAHHVCVL